MNLEGRALTEKWKGPYLGLLMSDIAVKLRGIDLWIRYSQLKAAPPQLCKTRITEPLKLKTTRDNGLQMSTLRLYKLKGIFIIVICVREREREKDFLCKGVSFFTFENVG